MKLDTKAFDFKPLSSEYIDEIVEMQVVTLGQIDNPDILRENSYEMLLACLNPPHHTVGAFYEDDLAAFAVLYIPDDGIENLAKSLEGIDVAGLMSANFKLVIVKPEYRGNGLQVTLSAQIEECARELGAGVLCATVSPDNAYSIHNIEKVGFIFNRTMDKYGSIRNVYYKLL